jgi:hypothetical protein
MARTNNALIAIRLPSTLKKRLEEKAERDGRSLSNWCLQRLAKDEGPSGSGSHSSK